MTDSYASLELGGEHRNVDYLGTFVAWLVSNDLLSDATVRKAGSAVARVRMQDMAGSSFLTTVLHGELRPTDLKGAGQTFAERYFVTGRYRDDYDSCEYEGENDWIRYDEVAPKITAAYRQLNTPRQNPVKRLAKVIKFPGR